MEKPSATSPASPEPHSGPLLSTPSQTNLRPLKPQRSTTNVEPSVTGSRVSRRDRPRTFRELLAESQASVRPVEADQRSLATKEEIDKLTRAYRSQSHRESPSEIVSKKRDIFLLQYSLDAKRAEIKRLREAAAKEEEDLKKEEAELEKAALEFDSFLEENDRKAMEALRRAEQETKTKLAKVKEIKKLQLALISVRSEISKSEEQLRDSLRCRKLLELLTPKSWLEENLYAPRRARRAEREKLAAQALAATAATTNGDAPNSLAARRGSKIAPNLRNAVKKITSGLRQVRIQSLSAAGPHQPGVEDSKPKAGQTANKPLSRRGSLASRRRSSVTLNNGKGQSEASLNKTKVAEGASLAALDDDPLAEISIDDPDSFDLEAVLTKLQDLEGDMEIPTYFTDPAQLLKEFERLEKENEALESVCRNEKKTVHRLEKELESEVVKGEREKEVRKAELDSLNREIAGHKETLQSVQKQHSSLIASLTEDQEQMLDELTRKVAELYLACCPTRASRGEDSSSLDSAPLSTAEMLTAVTQQLNTMLDTLENADASALKAAKEALVKERGRLKRLKTPKR